MTKIVRDVEQLSAVLGIPYSDEQIEAITAPLDRSQVIVAGAGSGKTAVMAARVVWLVGHVGVAPEKILGLTFTTKAAAELSARIRSSLGQAGVFLDEGEPTVSTYHAFAGALIREHGLRIGIEPDMQVIDDARRFQLAARAVRAYAEPLDHVSTHLPTTVNDLLALDSQLSEHLVSTATLREHDESFIADVARYAKQTKEHREAIGSAHKRIELSRLVDVYRAAKKSANVMTFADQMAWGAELARIDEVALDLRERFDVVLLDEYQDTSIAQRDLLQALFAGGAISAVGDPAQGIYGWRGAAAGNLTGFLDDFPGPGGQRGDHYSLSVTRRCAPEIIDLAGVVDADFYQRDDVREVVRPLRAAEGTAPGHVTASLHATVADEIESLAEAIIVERERGVPWAEIAVLVRNHSENESLVRTLRQRGIPVELVGLTGLLSQPEVRDVLSVLELLDDISHNPALLRLLTGPRWRIGDRDLALLGRRAVVLSRVASQEPTEEADYDETLRRLLAEATAGTDPTEVVSLLDAIDDPGDEGYGYDPAARQRFAEISWFFRRLRRRSHEPLPDLVRWIVHDLDLDVELSVAGIPSDNLAVFLDAVADFASEEPHASLGGLLSYLRAEEDHNNGMEVSAPSEADSVKVLTVHKAKGLEFSSVFVPFLSVGVFPPSQSRDNWLTIAKALPHPLRGDRDSVPQLQEYSDSLPNPFKNAVSDFKAELKADAHLEEMRLAYVALTRAKTRLHASGHHWGRTQVKPRGPSVFLTAIADWLSDRGEAPKDWALAPADEDTNPHQHDAAVAWPRPVDPMPHRRSLADDVLRLLEAPAPPITPPVNEELARLESDIEALLEEAAEAEEDTIVVELPPVMSATAIMAMAADETSFAAQLARPMPRRPVAAARHGTQFHAWLERRFGQQTLFEPTDIPGWGDAEIADDADLDALKRAFESSPWAHREPIAVETSFTLRLGGQNVVGQIDAIYETADGFEVVDWKTNRRKDADPLQLAVYRLAWAEHRGIDPHRVTASFCYVRLGETVTFTDLPDRAELEFRLGLT